MPVDYYNLYSLQIKFLFYQNQEHGMLSKHVQSVKKKKKKGNINQKNCFNANYRTETKLVPNHHGLLSTYV